MPDLSSLASKLTQEEIPVDYDGYVEPSEFPPPLPEGIYTLQQGKAKIDATADGYLVTIFEGGHKVVGGEFDGRTACTYDRISNKPFMREGVKVNFMTDRLRALGNIDRLSKHQEFADAIEAAEGKTFRVQIQWEAFCAHKGTPKEVTTSKEGFSLKGARRMPVNGNGQPVDIFPCPVCGQEMRARDKISRHLPADVASVG